MLLAYLHFFLITPWCSRGSPATTSTSPCLLLARLAPQLLLPLHLEPSLLFLHLPPSDLHPTTHFLTQSTIFWQRSEIPLSWEKQLLLPLPALGSPWLCCPSLCRPPRPTTPLTLGKGCRSLLYISIKVVPGYYHDIMLGEFYLALPIFNHRLG